LEVILATDLIQLGQVPKLRALAVNMLRTCLLSKLEAVITRQSLSACTCTGATCAEDKLKQVLLHAMALLDTAANV
jgi:uncharacterized membrane protein